MTYKAYALVASGTLPMQAAGDFPPCWPHPQVYRPSPTSNTSHITHRRGPSPTSNTSHITHRRGPSPTSNISHMTHWQWITVQACFNCKYKTENYSINQVSNSISPTYYVAIHYSWSQRSMYVRMYTLVSCYTCTPFDAQFLKDKKEYSPCCW